MNKLSCIVVEDEAPALNLLKIYTSRIPQLDVVGFFNRSTEAKEFLQRNDVDIIFTDINMPKVTGIELVKHARNKPFIIFISVNQQDGLDVEIADFLVKPVTFQRFLDSVNKVIDLQQTKKPY